MQFADDPIKNIKLSGILIINIEFIIAPFNKFELNESTFITTGQHKTIMRANSFSDNINLFGRQLDFRRIQTNLDSMCSFCHLP